PGPVSPIPGFIRNERPSLMNAGTPACSPAFGAGDPMRPEPAFISDRRPSFMNAGTAARGVAVAVGTATGDARPDPGRIGSGSASHRRHGAAHHRRGGDGRWS